MTPMMKTLGTWEDGLFDLLERVEEPVVRVGGEMADSLKEYAPERPAWPFMDRIPTLAEVVDFEVAFAHRFVDVQATFARDLLKAWQPVIGKFEPKPAPKPRVRTATKKA